ncbi:hypothetical protein FRB95_009860 [Tulasnella sp. JGI-2019a]|nr:hypothetical protein FRB95_009860 [Tulasnella sp. JGI-2019a]
MYFWIFPPERGPHSRLASYGVQLIVYSFHACIALPFLFLSRLDKMLAIPEPRDSKMDWVYSWTALLIAEAAPHSDDLLTVADNFPLISDPDVIRFFIRSTTFKQLLFEFQQALLSIRKGHNHHNVLNTVTLARAIAHAVLTTPDHTARDVSDFFVKVAGFEEHGPQWWGSDCHIIGLNSGTQNRHEDVQQIAWAEFTILLLSILNVCINGRWSFPGGHCEDLIHQEKTLRRALCRRKPSSPANALHRSTQTACAPAWFRYCLNVSSLNTLGLVPFRDIDALVKDTSDMFLFEGAHVDCTYLTSALQALLVVMGQRPQNGGSNGSLLIDVFGAFQKHLGHRAEELRLPFLRCQERLLKHVNALYPAYSTLLGDSHLCFRRMHSLLNDEINNLRSADLSPSVDVVLGSQSYRKTLVETLQRLLLTSPPPKMACARSEDLLGLYIRARV